MIRLLTRMGIDMKTGKVTRKEFVRTKISPGENIASVIILLLLVVIGVAIAITGGRFDPNLYMVRSGSLDATAAPVVGEYQTVRATTGAAVVPDQTASPEKPAAVAATPTENAAGGSETEGAPPAPPPAAAPTVAAGQPLEIALAGIKPMSNTEFYTADTLYEKIDGRAPAYQNFNVQGLRCRSFSVLAPAAAGSYVDVYEYRFDTPLDAFGMFASERDPKGKPTDFATDGYSGDMGYFFRQGAVYVQIIASDEKPETLAVATALAQNRAKTLTVDDTGVAARRELPATGLVADSVGFVADNAQGQESLKNVFQAKYDFEGTQLPFFIMVAPTDAARAWSSLQSFCGRFGKVEQFPDENGAKIFRAQIFGKWKVVYLRNNEIGGVFDASNGEKARTFVEEYLQGKIK